MTGLLFHFSFLFVFSYGLFLSLGVLVAAFVFWRELSHTSWDDDVAFSLVIKSLFWAFVFGRLGQLFLSYHLSWQYFFNWHHYPGVNGWLFWLIFWLLSWYQVSKRQWPEWQFLDILSWVSLVFLFWLSLACFGGWCWLGKETSFKLAWPIIGQQGLHYPLAIFHLILVLGLLGLFSRWRFRYKTLEWYKSKQAGFVFWLSQFLYAGGHFFFIDLWRVNSHPLWLSLDLSSWLWFLSWLILGVVFLFWGGILSLDFWLLIKSKIGELGKRSSYKSKRKDKK